MTEFDRIIHEPGRLVIMALLSGLKEAAFVYLQGETGQEPPDEVRFGEPDAVAVVIRLRRILRIVAP